MTVQRIVGARCPHWVQNLLGPGARPDPDGADDAVSCRVRETDDWALVEAVRCDAGDLDDVAFDATVRDLYGRIHDALRRRPSLRPVRWWNYVPAIQRPADDGRDRYMVFNAARHEAYRRWPLLLSDDGQPQASTGLDIRTNDLTIHVLATSSRGLPLQNPRQIPPSRYSRRYGPLPPHFARATRLKNGTTDLLLISGTSSVIGEESVHPSDIGGQIRETLANIEVILSEARHASVNGEGEAAGDSTPVPTSLVDEARAYVTRAEDVGDVERATCATFPNLTRLEIVDADLCRPELLVEIEATARLDR